MRTKFLPFVFSLFASVLVADLLAQAQTRANWPLAPEGESRVKWGELENGFRYAILQTEDIDEQAVSFRLVVDAGAGHEARDKRGAASFVSHLAFNGATSQDPEQLFDMFTANGMGFYSSRRTIDGLHYTSYNIDFDKANESSVVGVLDFYGDIAGGMDFKLGTVEREREYMKRSLGSSGILEVRNNFDVDKLIFDGGVYPLAEGAELLSSYEKLRPEDLESFWKAYYQPNRMTLFAVGLFHPDALEKLIQEKFSGLQNNNSKIENRLSANNKKRALSDIVVLKEQTALSAVTFASYESGVDFFKPENEKRYWEIEALGRYAQYVVDGGSRFDSGSVKPYRGGILLSTHKQGTIVKMEELLRSVDAGSRRMYSVEVEASEVNRLKEYYKQLISNNDMLLSEKELPRMLADRFVKNLAGNFPFRYGKKFGTYLRGIHENLDTQRFTEISQKFFDEKRSNLVISVPEALGFPSKVMTKRVKAMRKRYSFNWAVSTGERSSWDVKQYFGDSGLVSSTETFELGTEYGLNYVFQNSMRLNVVRRLDAPGVFTARLSIGNGLGDMESQFPGASRLLRELMQVSSMGDHDLAPILWDTLRGKGLNWVDTGVNQGQLYWQAEGQSPEDLFTFLSLLTEWIITADIREEDFDDAKERLLKMAEVGVPDDVASRDAVLFGTDVRLQRSYDKETLEDLDYTAINDWLIELAKSGYLELTIVGDVEPRTVLRDVRKTLGSREKRTGLVDQPRHGAPARYPEAGIERTVASGYSTFARMSMYWPLPYENGCDDSYRLDVLQKAFERYLLEKVKEFDGDLYSVFVTDSIDWMIPGSGMIRVDVDCPTGSAAALEKEVVQWVRDFSESLTEQRIRACELAVGVEYQNRFKGRNQLVYLLDQSQAKPAILKCASSIAEGKVSFALADYHDLVNTLFAEDNLRGVISTPGR